MSLSHPESLFGQKKRQTKINITIETVDVHGKPIAWSSVASSRNRYTYTSDENGKLQLTVLPADILKVMADGFSDKIVSVSDAEGNKLRITLEENSEYDDNSLYTVTGDYINEKRIVGTFSKVSGAELEKNPTMFIWDSFGGRLSGLFLMNNTLVPGFTSYDGYVRAPNGGTPIIMIDGVERSLDYIEPETIESVQLLKDASLKAFYGGIQSNGILLVKTKRGKSYENGVRVNFQTGVEIPTRLPGYLNSKEYTIMYNQALLNVGKAPIYDPSKYDGSNPILYPDVDYYDEFLNKAMTLTRANTQLTGGNNNTRYFLNLGFQTNGGLEKYTEYPNKDQVITARGNIDNTIYDFITFRVGLNAAIQKKTWPNISTQNFFNALSDTRPNEYPIRIPGDLVGSSEEYLLGGTSVSMDNPLGLLTKNGFVEREYSYLQSDFAIDVDMDRWIKGLSIRPSITFDIYNEFSSKKDGGFSVYEPVVDENGNISFDNWGYDNPNTKQVRGGVNTNRNWAFSTTAKYERSFGKNDLLAIANFLMQKQDYNDQLHSRKRMNTGVMVNYMYDKKYIVDASLNCVGVPSFAPSKRFGLFPTIGAAWILSNENFMTAEWVDYLKAKVSYGILGSTTYTEKGIVSNYYYRTEWAATGTYPFTSFDNIVILNQTGNPDADFQKSHEFNAGIEFGLFKNTISGSLGYFRNVLTGGLANLTDVTPGVSGKGGTLMWYNYKEYLSQGAEAELYYARRFRDFSLRIGGNFCYGYSEVTKDADIQWPDDLKSLAKTRRDGDVKGYHVIGLFEDQNDINSSPVQTFGKVYPGDFKYEDVNGDNVIDERDRKVIANTRPEIQYGIDIHLQYKGVNLDILGYGIAGFERMLTTKYYQIYGDRKYSDVLKTGLPNGNQHPAVRANESVNNFVNSDWWVVNGGYFKIRNVELGYTLPHNLSKKIGLNILKFFVRGTNLLTISKIDDLDPESLDAGVGNFPLATTITGGLSFSF